MTHYERVDPELMRLAVQVKREVIDSFPYRDVETETNILVTVYNILSIQRNQGEWPIRDAMIAAIISTLLENRINPR